MNESRLASASALASSPLRWSARYPAVSMAVGALGVSASAVFVRLSDTSPGTASFYRCVLALPLLVGLAAAETHREGRLAGRKRLLAAFAGALFAGDMILWTQAIAEIGAGLSTVVVNMQVVLVPLLALLLDREPVTRRFLLALPLLLVGVTLTAGVVDHGAHGASAAGTVHAALAAVCYAVYLYLLRRIGDGGRIVQAYRDVIAAAAVASVCVGVFWHGVDLAPGWAAVGWLVAVAACGQVVGWLLVAVAAPHLASHVGATLLLLTPVGAVVLGAVILHERPTLFQLAGCVLILACGYLGTTGGRPPADRPS